MHNEGIAGQPHLPVDERKPIETYHQPIQQHKRLICCIIGLRWLPKYQQGPQCGLHRWRDAANTPRKSLTPANSQTLESLYRVVDVVVSVLCRSGTWLGANVTIAPVGNLHALTSCDILIYVHICLLSTMFCAMDQQCLAVFNVDVTVWCFCQVGLQKDRIGDIFKISCHTKLSDLKLFDVFYCTSCTSSPWVMIYWPVEHIPAVEMTKGSTTHRRQSKRPHCTVNIIG